MPDHEKDQIQQCGCMYVAVSSFIMYCKERETHTDTERQKALSSSGSLLKCLKWPGLTQFEAKIPELSPGLLCVWKGPHYLSYHYMSPRVCINMKLKWRVELGPKSRHSGMGCQSPH